MLTRRQNTGTGQHRHLDSGGAGGSGYLAGVPGPEHVTGHVGLRVVGLPPQQVGEAAGVGAAVDEAGDELRLVLEDEHRRAAAAGGHAADEGGAEQQLHLPGLQDGAAAAPLAPPADLGHQPRQHGQRGPPVERAPADVSEEEAPLLLLLALHVDPEHFESRLDAEDSAELHLQISLQHFL